MTVADILTNRGRHRHRPTEAVHLQAIAIMAHQCSKVAHQCSKVALVDLKRSQVLC